MAHHEFSLTLDAVFQAKKALLDQVQNTTPLHARYVVTDENGNEALVEDDSLWLPAWERLTKLWMADGENGPTIGSMCITPEIAAQISVLNKAKLELKEAVGALKHSYKSKAAQLMEAVEGNQGRRNESGIGRALKNNRASALNLKQCYRQLLVIDSPVISLRWAWIPRHKSITPIKKRVALEMIHKAKYLDAWKIIQESKLGSDTEFAFIKHLPPGLRANVVYDDAEMGHVRKAFAVSGVILTTGPMPASMEYQSFEEQSALSAGRKQRTDRLIEDDALIPELNIYRYMAGYSTKKKVAK